jgi:hypothetical protein
MVNICLSGVHAWALKTSLCSHQMTVTLCLKADLIRMMRTMFFTTLKNLRKLVFSPLLEMMLRSLLKKRLLIIIIAGESPPIDS